MVKLKDKQDILNKCLNLVEQRGDEYGDDSFDSTAKILDACFNIKLSPWMIAAVLTAWKLSRQRNDILNQKRKEDTTLDAMNYLAMIDIERRQELTKTIQEAVDGTKID